MTVDFYWGSGSAPCRRAQIALEEKKVQYNSIEKHFSKGEHKAEDVLKVNPRGQLPALQDDGAVVNESIGALIFLDLQYPDNPLIPTDKAGRAKTIQRTLEALNVDGHTKTVVYPHFRGGPKPEEVEAYKKDIENFKAELTRWEGYLTEEYIAGPTFTLADIAVAPHLIFFERIGASYSDFPKIKEYLAKIKKRDSFIKTTPPHWATSDPPAWLTTYDV